MSLPVFASGQPLSAGAVNRLDEAIDDLADRAMSFAIPQLVVRAGYERGKRGYVVHRHEAALASVEVLVYDMLVAGVGSGKKVRVSYDGSTLYEFDGSDAAHGDGHQYGYWSLADFPTAETHPADDEWVQVDVEVVDGDAGTYADVYALREGLLAPDGYTIMQDALDVALGDDEDTSVPTDLQTLADNVLALQGLMHGRVAGFWPQSLEHGNINGGAVFTVGEWRYCTNMGDLLYYSLRVFKENEGVRGGEKITTLKIYLQPQSAPSATLVGTFYAGGKTDAQLGGGRGDRFYEGTLDISAVSRTQNEPCAVTVTIEYDGASTDGYGGCSVYMLREEAAAVPGVDAFAGVSYGEIAEGYAQTPALRYLWTNVQDRLAADTGDPDTGGYGTAGLDVANGFTHGWALVWFTNPVMFGGPQHNEELADTMTEARFVRSGDVLYFSVEGDAELAFSDMDGAEATRQLQAKSDAEPFRTLYLSDIDGLPSGAGFAVRSIATNNTGESAKNMLYGAWVGDAE